MAELIDQRKASVWAALAAVAQLALLFFGERYYPYLSDVLLGPAYALLLPAIAALHVRQVAFAASGAVLGTVTGTAAVVLAALASLLVDARPFALFVTGMWWWTIGKLWATTGVLPRSLGLATAAGAVALLAGSLAFTASAELFGEVRPWDLARGAVAVWTALLAVALWPGARA